MARLARMLILVLSCAVATGCLDDPVDTCDEERPCGSPDKPFCDLEGIYGEPGTCVAPPSPDAGPDAAD